MNPMIERLNAPIPKIMRTLRKDARGYPVPYIVMIDKSGLPQFTINDGVLVRECIRKKLCSICGKKLSALWFVGGSRSFLHERGAFLDPPLHLECAEYALVICPFLATRSFTHSINDAKLDRKNLPDNLALVVPEFSGPILPERFGLGLTPSYEVYSDRGNLSFHPAPWQYLEFWKNGKPCQAPDTGEGR